MKQEKIDKIVKSVTHEVSKTFEQEYQKNLKNHSDELPGFAAANALHDSVPFLISSITEEILKRL